MRKLARKLGGALAVGAWIFVVTFPLMSFSVTTRQTAGLEHAVYFALTRVEERRPQDPIILFRSAGARLALALALLGILAVLVRRFAETAPGRRLREAVGRRVTRLREGMGRAVTDPKFRPVTLGALLLLLALVPALLSPLDSAAQEKTLNWLISIAIWIILASGLNITVGMAGLLVLGYAAFYAVGAYTFAILSTRVATAAVEPDAAAWLVWLHESGATFWIAIPLAGIIAALFGLVLGLPSLRLRGDYLAIVTLGFGETVRYFLKNVTWLTGGEKGIDVRAHVPYPKLLGFEISGEARFYYLILFLCVATVFLVSRLNNSRIGRAWIAVREDEVAAEAMGVPTVRMKLLAFSLSAVWAGIAGVFFGRYQGFVNPDSFTFNESVLVLSMVVLGGMGSNTGVILGAAILYSIPRFLRDFSGSLKQIGLDIDFSDYRLLIFGLIMVLMMIFRPQGILGGQRRKIEFETEPAPLAKGA